MIAEVETVGVDGCPGGWIAVFRKPDGLHAVKVFASFVDLLTGFQECVVVAVDMPIGLPERTAKGGRGPEMLVRPLLGERQSSVFSIPSRTAVYCESGPFSDAAAVLAAHRRASEVARMTSDPPRAVSIQAFGLFPKIREIDALLAARPDLRLRIFESHPEVAFRSLNGGTAMRLPKKIKGVVNSAGMAERRDLLSRRGFSSGFLEMRPPKGAAADDFLDAAAMFAIAGRIARGEARPYPDPPLADSRGIPIAIWA